MESSDIPEVLNIQSKCNLSFWSESDYLEELKRNDSLLLSAKLNGAVIGFIGVRLIMNQTYIEPNSSFLNNKNEAEIYNIGVDPNHQQKGIGSLLLEEFLCNISKNEIKTIWLEVRASNAKAIGFYKHFGFMKSYIRKNFYTNPTEDALVLKLDRKNIT